MDPRLSITPRVAPSGIRAIFDQAAALEAAGRRCLRLDVGLPHHPPPPELAELAAAAAAGGYHRYVTNRGLLELREAWAADLARRGMGGFDPESELIVTTGGSEAMAMAALALLRPGDEILVPTPAWPHYAACAALAGASCRAVPGRAEEGWRLDPGRIAAAVNERTRMLVVNTPSNPTGAVQPRETLLALAELADKHGLWLISDEVYKDFVFQGEHVSLAGLARDYEGLILIDSLSKSFALTGWRMGLAGAAPRASAAMNAVHQYLTVCGVAFAQRAAALWLADPHRLAYLDEIQEAFAPRLAVWQEALAGAPGIALGRPQGAFYLFPRLTVPGADGSAFCARLLAERGLAMVPGEVFGADHRDGLRISYGGPLAVQEEAAALLAEALTEAAA